MRFWKLLALVIAVVMVVTIPFSVMADEVPADGNDPEENTEAVIPEEELVGDVAEENTEETITGESEDGESAEGEDGESEEGQSADGESADFEGEIGTFLTEDTFDSKDIPEDYLKRNEHGGTVERVRIIVLDNGADGKIVKSALVYLPYGYDDNEEPYNIIYLLHASGGSASDYFDLNSPTKFQKLLDNMIANGDMDPVIVVAPNYFESDSFMKFMPLARQVEEISEYPDELVNLVIPAVEEMYRTYAETTDAEGLRQSRDHRAVVGFSLGGTVAWYTFIQKMFAFRWFIPLSEASWDDGNDGIGGIWDSDLSAQVLYDAVLEQGFTSDDFYLFVATGTEDEAFEIATEQMKSLLEYNDLFITGKNTSCSMMIDGMHNLSALNTYLYHMLPVLFSDFEEAETEEVEAEETEAEETAEAETEVEKTEEAEG